MSAADPPTDGRTARAQRTREAIVDALLSLLEEGDLAPTAPRIAERASVSLRSIYQHFEDLESLFDAVGERQFERILGLAVRLPDEGPLATRIEAVVAQRSTVLEAMTAVRRAALLQEPLSPRIRANRERADALARREVERVFARELAAVPDGAERVVLLDALDVVAGWSTWNTLRSAGRRPAEARAVVARALTALLAGPTSPHQSPGGAP